MPLERCSRIPCGGWWLHQKSREGSEKVTRVPPETRLSAASLVEYCTSHVQECRKALGGCWPLRHVARCQLGEGHVTWCQMSIDGRRAVIDLGCSAPLLLLSYRAQPDFVVANVFQSAVAEQRCASCVRAGWQFFVWACPLDRWCCLDEPSTLLKHCGVTFLRTCCWEPISSTPSSSVSSSFSCFRSCQ